MSNYELHIEKNVTDAIPRDPLLELFVNEVKLGIQAFEEQNVKKLQYTLKYERDCQIPDWKKLILYFDLDEPDFNRKVQFWDQLDDAVRKQITCYSTLKHLNKNFFIEPAPDRKPAMRILEIADEKERKCLLKALKGVLDAVGLQLRSLELALPHSKGAFKAMFENIEDDIKTLKEQYTRIQTLMKKLGETELNLD